MERMIIMSWGGRRKGAGRPPAEPNEIRKARSIKMTDEEWAMAKRLAESEGLSASEYIRKVSLKQS